MRLRGRWHGLLRAFAAGGALWGAFPDLGLWPLSIVAMVLLLSVVDRVSMWDGGLYAGIAGVVFWFPHLQWAQISAGGGPLPWVALSLTQVIPWVLWGASASVITRLPIASSVRGYVLVMALSWTGLEQLRARVPFSGFPWGNVAYPQVDSPLGSFAPWGGETLVSFIVVMVAAFIRCAFSLSDRGMLARLWWGRLACLLTAGGLVLVGLLLPMPVLQENGSLRVGAIQGFVDPPGAKSYAVEGQVSANHARVTSELVHSGGEVDLIFWGEGALDRDPRRSDLVRNVVERSVKDAGVPIMVGFNEYDSQRHVIHNLYGAWDPGVGLAERLYGKQIPVPFGEYIPFRSFVSALATEAAQVSVDMEGVDNSARLDVTLVDGRVVPLGVGICFEVAYEGVWAESVRSGSELLVSPSNNYHFRTSPEPAQQAQIARFRAMEFARSTVQVSTTGESMLIRPNGGVLSKTGRHEPGWIAGDLPLRHSVTWAAWTAVPLAWSVMLGWAVMSVAGVVHVLRKQRSPQ